VEFARTQNPDYDELISKDKRLQRSKEGVIPWMLGGTSQPTLQKEGGEGSGGD
jgi:hypothetical protein